MARNTAKRRGVSVFPSTRVESRRGRVALPQTNLKGSAKLYSRRQDPFSGGTTEVIYTTDAITIEGIQAVLRERAIVPSGTKTFQLINCMLCDGKFKGG